MPSEPPYARGMVFRFDWTDWETAVTCAVAVLFRYRDDEMHLLLIRLGCEWTVPF